MQGILWHENSDSSHQLGWRCNPGAARSAPGPRQIPGCDDRHRGQAVCGRSLPGPGILRRIDTVRRPGRAPGMAGARAAGQGNMHEKVRCCAATENAFDAAWLVWRAGVPERIGYARDGRGFLLTKAVAVPREGEIPAHEKFYYLELLRRTGWIASLPNDGLISLEVPAAVRRRAAERLLEAGASPNAIRVAIGAGASYGSAKCWPPERFAEWANWLQARSNAEVILFGAAAEATVSEAIVATMRRKPIDFT